MVVVGLRTSVSMHVPLQSELPSLLPSLPSQGFLMVSKGEPHCLLGARDQPHSCKDHYC